MKDNGNNPKATEASAQTAHRALTLQDLQRALDSSINPAALTAFNGHVTLYCEQPGAALHLQLDHGALHWHRQPERTDATFYFTDCEQAQRLLTGRGNVIAEFMAGRFRSSGYLLWTFPVLGLFTGTSD